MRRGRRRRRRRRRRKLNAGRVQILNNLPHQPALCVGVALLGAPEHVRRDRGQERQPICRQLGHRGDRRSISPLLTRIGRTGGGHAGWRRS